VGLLLLEVSTNARVWRARREEEGVLERALALQKGQERRQAYPLAAAAAVAVAVRVGHCDPPVTWWCPRVIWVCLTQRHP